MRSPFLFCLFLGALATSAYAADEPGIQVTEALAITGFPTGLFLDTTIQAQTPIFRSDSLLFSDSFVGAGVRAGVSPAFVEFGPRITFKPLAVFQLDLEATHTSYFYQPLGLMGMPDIGNEKASVRRERVQNGESFTGEAWTLMAQPTFFMKVGPIVGMSQFSYAWMHIKKPEDVFQPYVFEQYRGIVQEWNDLVVGHFHVLMYEFMDGKDKPLLRIGGLVRGKWAKNSPDYSLTAGGVVMWKPGVKPTVPTIIGLASAYVLDTDYVGGPPFFALMATWTFDRPFRKKSKKTPMTPALQNSRSPFATP